MQRKIKCVIFDLDGTLVDAFKAVARSLNFAFKEMHLPGISEKTVKRRVGLGEVVLVGSFVPKNFLDETLIFYRKHHTEALKTGTKFLPGARKVLRQLKKKGYKLAIASNRPTTFTKIILKHLKVENYFDCILCADKVRRPKPSGIILKVILQKLSLRPSEAVYVGDMTIDVQTGNRAHVKTICVLTGSCTRREITREKPFKIISRLEDLLKFID